MGAFVINYCHDFCVILPLRFRELHKDRKLSCAWHRIIIQRIFTSGSARMVWPHRPRSFLHSSESLDVTQGPLKVERGLWHLRLKVLVSP